MNNLRFCLHSDEGDEATAVRAVVAGSPQNPGGGGAPLTAGADTYYLL